MTEVDAMEFYQRVTDSKSTSTEYTLEHTTGAELTVELNVVERKFLLDEIARLPDEMLDTLTEAEDEDEAQEMAEDEGMLSNVNGDTILAFENICVEAISHPELTTHNIEDIVSELSFEVLFEMGSIVLERSFEETGSVEGFREAGSGKSS